MPRSTKTPAPQLELSPFSEAGDVYPDQNLLAALSAAGVPLADFAVKKAGYNQFDQFGRYYCTIGACRRFAWRRWTDTTTGNGVTDCGKHTHDEVTRAIAWQANGGRATAELVADERDRGLWDL